MSSPSKIKGSNFEREIVNLAKDYGLEAKRAYASNGISLGQHEEVDVIISGLTAQLKRRKKIGKLFKPNENVDIQIVREDQGQAYVIMPIDKFLKLLHAESS